MFNLNLKGIKSRFAVKCGLKRALEVFSISLLIMKKTIFSLKTQCIFSCAKESVKLMYFLMCKNDLRTH